MGFLRMFRTASAFVVILNLILIDLTGIADCCLFAKGNVCICDKFVDKGSRVIIPQKQDGRLPKRVKEEILTTGEINSYIQTLSKV